MIVRRVAGPIILLLLAVMGVGGAQTAMPLDPELGIVTIPLYSVTSPSSSTPANTAADPTLTVFAPQPGLANGTAVIIAPGGAYLRLASNLEGRQVAD